jgi:hypothetical protein
MSGDKWLMSLENTHQAVRASGTTSPARNGSPPMTRDEFEAALTGIGINQTTFAALTGMDRKTVYGWGKERTISAGRREHQPVPSWVPVMLKMWQAAPRVLVRIIKRLGDEPG